MIGELPVREEPLSVKPIRLRLTTLQVKRNFPALNDHAITCLSHLERIGGSGFDLKIPLFEFSIDHLIRSQMF